MGNKPPKQHKCKECGAYYVKTQSTQQVCSVACAMKMGKRKAAERAKKKERADLVAEKKRMAALKEKVKTRREWMADLQRVFNRFIRLRDQDKPCISCGRFHSGKYDAGHYLSVGGHPELRFHEDNVHRQCVPCNQHKSGNSIEYRLGLIERIGIERVEFLERKDHPPLKLSADDIKDLIRFYKAKIKELE